MKVADLRRCVWVYGALSVCVGRCVRECGVAGSDNFNAWIMIDGYTCVIVFVLPLFSFVVHQ